MKPKELSDKIVEVIDNLPPAKKQIFVNNLIKQLPDDVKKKIIKSIITTSSVNVLEKIKIDINNFLQNNIDKILMNIDEKMKKLETEKQQYLKLKKK